MSNRYRVEVDVIDRAHGNTTTRFILLDYCVLPGQMPKVVGEFHNALQAWKDAQELNTTDDKSKTAWDAFRSYSNHDKAPGGTPGTYGVDMAAPGTKDDTAVSTAARSGAYSMDIETHAKRYFVGPGLDNAVYGSHQAIDSLRAKLNDRYLRIQELTKVNAKLRENLKSAQAAADGHKAVAIHNNEECKKLMHERDAAISCLKLVQEDGRSAELDRCYKAATSRAPGVPLDQHIVNLEKMMAGWIVSGAQYWHEQSNKWEASWYELKRKISEL